MTLTLLDAVMWLKVEKHPAIIALFVLPDNPLMILWLLFFVLIEKTVILLIRNVFIIDRDKSLTHTVVVNH